MANPNESATSTTFGEEPKPTTEVEFQMGLGRLFADSAAATAERKEIKKNKKRGKAADPAPQTGSGDFEVGVGHGRPSGSEFWKKKTVLYTVLGSVAVLAASAALFVPSLLAKGGDIPKTGGDIVTTAPSQMPEHTVDPSNPEAYTFTAKVEKQITSVEEMKAMELADYAKLGIGDHAAFMLSQIPPEVATVASDSEAADIETLLNPAIIPQNRWIQTISVAYGQEDTLNGAKIEAGLMYYTTLPGGEINPGYQESVDDIMSPDGGGQNVGVSTSYKFEGAGSLQSGVDLYGNPVDWMNISVTPQDNYTEELGETTTIQALRVPVELADGSVYYVYPMGLTTNGIASPVAGAQY